MYIFHSLRLFIFVNKCSENILQAQINLAYYSDKVVFEIFSLLLGASKRGWPSGKLIFNSFHAGKFPDLRQDSIKFLLLCLVDMNGPRCQVSSRLEIERERQGRVKGRTAEVLSNYIKWCPKTFM